MEREANWKTSKMDWSLLFKILIIFQIFDLSQNSHVQHAKQRIRSEVGSIIGDSVRSIPYHKQQYSPEIATHQYEHFHGGSRRVHRLHRRHRNRWSTGHRKFLEYHHFTGWSAWSACNDECVKRRERYCKSKRKCGLTKHLEERKCTHCIPKLVWQQQAAQHVDSISPHHHQQQQQQQTINHGGSPPQPIIINAAAAASAPMQHQYVLPMEHTTTVPTPHETIVHHHHHEIQLPVLHEVVSNTHHSQHNIENVDIDPAGDGDGDGDGGDDVDDDSGGYVDDTGEYEREEDVNDEDPYPSENHFEPEIPVEPEESPELSVTNSIANDYDNQNDNGDDSDNEYGYDDQSPGDFYIFNRRPRYRKHRHRVPLLTDSPDYSELEEPEEDHDEESEEFGMYSSERKDHDARQLGLVHSTQRSHHRKRNKRRRRKGRQHQIQIFQRSKNRLRNLSPSNVDHGVEGDTFQYEDFDFDTPEVSSTGNGGFGVGLGDGDTFGYGSSKMDNQFADSYEDSNYDDTLGIGAGVGIGGNRNSTFLLQSKEKATPDAMIPRHRRLYSKWSRWTKCSPKCTTRRYKKCRVREQCGREVLREIAYCYTEGSFCQQWLQAQIQKSSPYELRPIAASRRRDMSVDGDGDAGGGGGGGGTHSNSIVSDYIMNSKGYRGPEYTPMKLKCGIAPMRNGKRSMYNMLKIIGGKAARKGEWPWQVAIFNRFKEAFCGGTLIAPQWVLTAAHCVRKVLYVRIGEHNLDYEDGTEMQLRVLKSFKHPNFDKKTVDSDVALLRLPKSVNTTTWIGFSCLPRPYQPLPKNVDCTVIGWGKRRNRDAAGTSVLHQADVPIISMDNCRSVYQDYTITKNMFCAGHKRGRVDTCAGDSGGPLLCRDTTKPNHPWTIFGITSFGDGCAKRNKFGIYAKVPNYVDWVWSVINCNGNCKLHQRNYG